MGDIIDINSYYDINILLIDDDGDDCSFFSEALKQIDTSILFTCGQNSEKVYQYIEEAKPHLIFMDINMPGISGIEAVAMVRIHFPEIKVLMQTVFDDNHKVFESIRNGAVGYILKTLDPLEIPQAVLEAHSGGAPMTPIIASKVLNMFRHQSPSKTEQIELSNREREVLTLLTRGFSYKMIAAECEISIDTVRFYIKKIYEKLHVHSMTEAVSQALKRNLI